MDFQDILLKKLFVDKNEFSGNPYPEIEHGESSSSKSPNYNKILSDVEEVLRDKDKMQEIEKENPKGIKKEAYIKSRNARIDHLLELAGNISYDNYIMAIKKTRRHGSTVLLQRDIDEIYINNYNPEWLLAWNANLDIQPVLDYFAVITYVTDYWAKPDQGITEHLKEAAKNLRSEPDQQKRCQQMANTFMTHRQMGESEAYYKILPSMTLKYSSIDTIFIPSDKKELRSKFLMKLDDKEENKLNGTEVQGGRDGLFVEKPDLIDKYCRREIIEQHLELNELCPVQFGKMFQPIQRRKEDETEEKKGGYDIEVGNTVEEAIEKDNENDPSKYIITTNPHYKKIKLPTIIKIKDPLPGEVAIWVKRKFPKAARMHKKTQDNNPHRFFLSELMLYTGYSDEQQLGCNDEDKCRQLYLEKQEDIQFVKKHLMPFAQGVEEARHFVQQAMTNEENATKNVGDELDPTLEQEILECQDEEDLMHPDYVQMNPDNFEFENNVKQIKKTLKNIEVKSPDEILREARNLDRFQKMVLHIAIKFAQDLVIAKKGKGNLPVAPFLMAHGGAGM